MKRTSVDHGRPPAVASIQLGVWRVLFEDTNSTWMPAWKRMMSYRYTLQRFHLRRFLTEIFFITPSLFILYILLKTWSGLEQALLLRCSTVLLKALETNLTASRPDSAAIITALLARIAVVSIASVLRWSTSYLEPVLRTRLKTHFQHKIIQAHFKADLKTSQDNSSKLSIKPENPWLAFREIFNSIDLAFSAASQFAFVSSFANAKDGSLIFAVLCVIKPLAHAMLNRDLFSRPFVIHAHSAAYCRILSLEKLATDAAFKQDVICGTLEDYIDNEYREAREALGDCPDDFPGYLYERFPTPIPAMILDLLSELPFAYFALSSILRPGVYSLASLAMMQQTSSSLRSTFERFSLQKSRLIENLTHVKTLVAMLDSEDVTRENLLPYPCREEGCEDAENNEGMSVEFRHVNFKYPGSGDAARDAVKDVSFTFGSSDLIVIVGTNGSGKSSIVKLLAGLYHPDSGDILVDGHDIKDYQIVQLREAMAVLSQDHNLFPLSVSENIGVGYSSAANREELIREAAKLGGAYDFVCKSGGFDRMLSTISTTYASQYPVRAGPLRDMFDQLEPKFEVSRGEQQRLVAARMFMRTMSGNIKLVIVDEPSSAMDPDGEWQLFEKLRETQAGKTMVFVTHRFGHLTKHANLILCMKDGELVESGTHSELIEKDGEYAKLYNVQAQAFSEVSPSA